MNPVNQNSEKPKIKQDEPNSREMSQNYPNWTKVVQICKNLNYVNPTKWSKINQVEQNR